MGADVVWAFLLMYPSRSGRRAWKERGLSRVDRRYSPLKSLLTMYGRAKEWSKEDFVVAASPTTTGLFNITLSSLCMM